MQTHVSLQHQQQELQRSIQRAQQEILKACQSTGKGVNELVNTPVGALMVKGIMRQKGLLMRSIMEGKGKGLGGKGIGKGGDLSNGPGQKGPTDVAAGVTPQMLQQKLLQQALNNPGAVPVEKMHQMLAAAMQNGKNANMQRVDQANAANGSKGQGAGQLGAPGQASNPLLALLAQAKANATDANGNKMSKENLEKNFLANLPPKHMQIMLRTSRP